MLLKTAAILKDFYQNEFLIITLLETTPVYEATRLESNELVDSLWKETYGNLIAHIRERELLIMVEFQSEDITTNAKNECLQEVYLSLRHRVIESDYFPR